MAAVKELYCDFVTAQHSVSIVLCQTKLGEYIMQFNYKLSAIMSSAILATSLHLVMVKSASAAGLPIGMSLQSPHGTNTSNTLVAQSGPIIRIPGRQSGPVIRIPGQQSSTRSVVLVNGTFDWITYSFNGKQFQLKPQEKRFHRASFEESSEVKFDKMNIGEQYHTQDITRNVTPGHAYTFQRGGLGAVDLY